jgi:polar amino acid transport system substrate-binding protein
MRGELKMSKKLTGLIVAFTFFGTVSPLSAESVFRIVFMGKENPPRIMGEGASIDWAKPGITLELLKMVEKNVGLQFQFKRIPWKRCLYMVEHGLADATFHASYKPDRAIYGLYPKKKGMLDPTRSIYKNSYVFYVQKRSGVRWDGKKLNNVSRPIGTQLSYAITDDLRKMGYDIEEEASATSNLDKLVAGRISAYADLESIVDSTLRKYKPRYETIEKLHPPLREKDYYLLISKSFAQKYPQLTETIWDALRDVQLTEAYRKMLNKYKD